jgi:hypothetical protein
MRLKDDFGLTSFGLCVGTLATLLAIAVVFGAACWMVESHECSVAARHLHRGSSYSFLGGGCYVQVGHGEMVQLAHCNGFRPVR